MNTFDVQANERIRYLIEEIQQKLSYEVTYSMQDCEELLALSEKHGYLYGVAYAHIHLANHYQILNNTKLYEYHSGISCSIAKRKDYFDVLILYYSIAGLRHIKENDDTNAIEMYLEGIKLAISINDKLACSKFYNNVAEIYYNVKEYDEAEKFYIQSLHCLNTTYNKDIKFFRKIVLANLIRVAYIHKHLEKAKNYYEQFNKIQCELDIITPIVFEVNARISILENDIKKAKENLEQLFEILKVTRLKNMLLENLYLYLIEILMSLEEYSLADRCIQDIESIDQCDNINIKLSILKYKIELNRLKGRKNKHLYREFYNETSKFENANKAAMGESLKSFINLYEAEKEQSKMIMERSYLENEAKYDELTGIYNRRYLSKILSKHLQDNSIEKIAYIMIDVDYFKEFNDFYGHLQGDYALKEVANCLQSNVVEDAYVARYGGDEFSCLFINHDTNDVIAYVENVQNMLQSKKIQHVKNKNSNYISLSFGIYCCEASQVQDELYLLKKADDALYQAKKKGRNTYYVYK